MNDSGTNVLCEYHSATRVGYWPGSNGIENADRPDARMAFRQALFIPQPKTCFDGKRTVRRQSIVACIPAQNDDTIQK